MPRRGLARVWPKFWFKTLGSSAFITALFVAYIHLLKHPTRTVTEMPMVWLDSWIAFQPAAVLLYLSLWVYVSLPVALMVDWRDIVGFGWKMAVLCLIGLGCFALWPTAVPPAHIDWAAYPGLDVLKGVDAAGNACPSLHVGTAVFAALWLDWMTPYIGAAGRWRVFNAMWCLGIAYSTVAVRQHVVLDVVAGALLGAVVACATRPKMLLRG